MSNSLSQVVTDNVLPFSGEELDVEIALKRYLRRCEVAFEAAKADEEHAFLNSLIVRLHIKAFKIADSSPLRTVKQLKLLLKEICVKPLDLDSINAKVRRMRQRQGKPCTCLLGGLKFRGVTHKVVC